MNDGRRFTDHEAKLAWEQNRELASKVSKCIIEQCLTPEEIKEINKLPGPRQAKAAQEATGTGWKQTRSQTILVNGKVMGFILFFKKDDVEIQRKVGLNENTPTTETPMPIEDDDDDLPF